MEEDYKKFIMTFYQFIYDLNRYSPSKEAEKVLEIYSDLDMAKVIFRTYHLLKDNSDIITNKNDTLFGQPFIVLPSIDISTYWPNLIRGQKDKLWTYLNILLIQSDILMNHKNPMKNEPDIPTKLTENSDAQAKLEFNPYVGISPNGQTENKDYGVNEMFANIPTFEDDKPTGAGIESLIGMMGVNKMINLEELSDQLKNMKKEDIENATNNIKGFLGSNVDEKTTNLITDMLSNISDELKNSEMGSGDPFKKILSVAESVAGKMRPTIDKDNIDVSQLINSTQVFANQCKDKDGNPMFKGNMNPFAMLGQFANNINNNGLTDNQCLEQCNDMLKNLGLNNIDLNNANLGEITKQMQKSMNPKNKKKKKK